MTTHKLLLVSLLFFILPVFGQSQINPFSKGVNFSNWFQTNGPQQVQLNKYNLKDFEQVKSLGCDVIRVPINMFDMSSGSPDYTIDPLFFTFVDSLFDWAEKSQMNLILDNHSFENSVIMGSDNGAFLTKFWPQLAYRYKDAYENVFFEILNEPHDISDAKWNTIQMDVIQKIRMVDPNRWLIIGPAEWNSFHNLQNMPVYDDDKLIYTFHFYDPFIFTHQGASWVEPSMTELKGVPFPYIQSEMPPMPSTFAGSWLQTSYNNYPSEGNKYKVQQLLDIAIDFKNSRNVPIYCGEFGVLIDHADPEDRNYWYNVVSSYLENNGVAWTTWDYHGGFGIFEPGGNDLFDYDLNIELIEALGLNPPAQSEFQIKADSSSLNIYDDYIAKDIFESSNSSGSISMYDMLNPKEGIHCIRWSDPNQYNQLGFDFRPNRDLSVLRQHDYKLEMWIKGDRPGAKLDIRFVDSKTGVDDDRPWRMRITVDENMVSWDGNWHKISVPLKDFIEHGSWDDNTWFEPIGAFDWKDIDRIDIVDEYGIAKPANFYFDEMKITGLPLNITDLSTDDDVLIYPNPADQSIHIVDLKSRNLSWQLCDLNGRVEAEGKIEEGSPIPTLNAANGVYILKMSNGKNINFSKRIIIHH